MAPGTIIRKLNTIAVTLFLITVFTGCGTQQARISYRASDALIYNNPIKNIALVGESRVMRPRMGGKDAVLSLSSSKLLLEDALPKLKSAFESKGYSVVSATTAGIGYYWRAPDDYWVYDFDAKASAPDKWRVDSMNPVFEYPELKSDTKISSAVRDEFERLNDFISMNRVSVYFPDVKNVSTIAQSTGADTVCFTRLWGERYSAGRVAGDIALKVLVVMLGGAPTGGLQEKKTITIVCSNAKTKQLVWQNTYTSFEDPIRGVNYKAASDIDETISVKSPADIGEVSANDDSVFVDSFYIKAINDLPDAGDTFSTKCKFTDRAKLIVSCPSNNDSNTVAKSY